jgi:hypothetical protein
MSVADLVKTSTTLLEAGVKMEDIPKTITRMGEAARFANIELEESANALLRASRGEVGARDITTATRLSGDESGRLQATYKDISVTIPNMAKEMERTQRATERTRQDADRLATRTTQDTNLIATRSTADLDKMITRATSDLDKLTGAQSSFSEAHGGDATFNAFRGISGGKQGPSARANAELMKELREGTAQISKEEGIDAMALVRSGEIKINEVIQAYGRAHEALETKASRGREDTNLGAARGREDVDTKEARGREDAGTRNQPRERGSQSESGTEKRKGKTPVSRRCAQGIGGRLGFARYCSHYPAAQLRGVQKNRTRAVGHPDSQGPERRITRGIRGQGCG